MQDIILPLSLEGFDLLYVKSLDNVLIWDTLAPPHNLLLQKKYLCSLEVACPEGMQMRYAILRRNAQPIGVYSFQIKTFRLGESLHDSAQITLSQRFKNWIKSKLAFNLIICGSVVNSGEHGFYILPESNIAAPQQAALLSSACEALSKQLGREGIRARAFLTKDYLTPKHHEWEATLSAAGFGTFQAQPGMTMQLPEAWHTFDDYLAALNAKSRTRTKRALKKSEPIIRRELTIEEVALLNPRLYELYQEVARGVGFSMFVLHPDYFKITKAAFGDEFKVFAYELDGKIIAFYSTFLNKGELECHFLGLEHAYNGTHQAYLNVLFDLVKLGIIHRCHSINFSRTALEIKSSVGAIPNDLFFYIRHTNPIFNYLLKRFYGYFNPKDTWTPRHPFH